MFRPFHCSRLMMGKLKFLGNKKIYFRAENPACGEASYRDSGRASHRLFFGRKELNEVHGVLHLGTGLYCRLCFTVPEVFQNFFLCHFS